MQTITNSLINYFKSHNNISRILSIYLKGNYVIYDNFSDFEDDIVEYYLDDEEIRDNFIDDTFGYNSDVDKIKYDIDDIRSYIEGRLDQILLNADSIIVSENNSVIYNKTSNRTQKAVFIDVEANLDILNSIESFVNNCMRRCS